MSSDVEREVDRILAEFVRLRLLPSSDSWRGCSAAQLGDIEAKAGRPMPVAHRHFLGKVGDSEGVSLFLGSDMYWPRVAEVTDGTDELLAENGLDSLPHDAFGVLLHQGYIAYWTVGAQSDPPVWLFSEGTTDVPELAFDRYTNWLWELGTEWSRAEP